MLKFFKFFIIEFIMCHSILWSHTSHSGIPTVGTGIVDDGLRVGNFFVCDGLIVGSILLGDCPKGGDIYLVKSLP